MTVSTLVLLGLAVLWAIVLLPEAFKKFSGIRNSDTIGSFHRHLSTLERSNPRVRRGVPRQNAAIATTSGARSNVVDLRSRRADNGSPAPQVRSQQRVAAPAGVSPAARKRRQDILIALTAAAVLTMVCTVAFGRTFLYLHLIADGLLLAYVLLLHQSASPQRSVAGAHRSAGARQVRPAGSGSTAIGRVTPAEVRSVAN